MTSPSCSCCRAARSTLTTNPATTPERAVAAASILNQTQYISTTFPLSLSLWMCRPPSEERCTRVQRPNRRFPCAAQRLERPERVDLVWGIQRVPPSEDSSYKAVGRGGRRSDQGGGAVFRGIPHRRHPAPAADPDDQPGGEGDDDRDAHDIDGDGRITLGEAVRVEEGIRVPVRLARVGIRRERPADEGVDDPYDGEHQHLGDRPPGEGPA